MFAKLSLALASASRSIIMKLVKRNWKCLKGRELRAGEKKGKTGYTMRRLK